MSGQVGEGEGMARVTAMWRGRGGGTGRENRRSLCLSPVPETVRTCSQDHAEVGGGRRKTVL